MIKTSRFADQAREVKLNKLGDALRVIEQHVDFAALADEADRAASRPSAKTRARIEHVFACMALWAARHCAPSVWRARRCSSMEKSLHTLCGVWST